jgi:hypothetical protein
LKLLKVIFGLKSLLNLHYPIVKTQSEKAEPTKNNTVVRWDSAALKQMQATTRIEALARYHRLQE